MNRINLEFLHPIKNKVNKREKGRKIRIQTSSMSCKILLWQSGPYRMPKKKCSDPLFILPGIYGAGTVHEHPSCFNHPFFKQFGAR